MMMIGMFMVSSTIAESVEAHQRSFDRGIQIGHQRRNKVGFSLYMLNYIDWYAVYTYWLQFIDLGMK